MRKKYLSALLFGALLFASTGTFTSCKDYDDDINNLNQRVDQIAADLNDLKTKVDALGCVESIEFSNGQLIVHTASGDVSASMPEYTGIKEVKLEGNTLYVDGVEAGKVELTGEDGETIHVPVITVKDGKLYVDDQLMDIEIGSNVVLVDNGDTCTLTVDGQSVTLMKSGSELTAIQIEDLKMSGFTNVERDNTTGNEGIQWGVAAKATPDWAGTKGAIAMNQLLIGQISTVNVQVTPADYDLGAQELALVDARGNKAPVNVEAVANNLLLPASRAASSNGSWILTINIDETQVNAANIADIFKYDPEDNSNHDLMGYTLCVNGKPYTTFDFSVKTAAAKSTNKDVIEVKTDNLMFIDANGRVKEAGEGKIPVGTTTLYVADSDLYDYYLTFEGTNKSLANQYGIKIGDDKKSIVVPAGAEGVKIAVTVHTASVTGQISPVAGDATSVNQVTLRIAGTEIEAAEVAAVTHQIKPAATAAEVLKEIRVDFKTADGKNVFESFPAANLEAARQSGQFKVVEDASQVGFLVVSGDPENGQREINNVTYYKADNTEWRTTDDLLDLSYMKIKVANKVAEDAVPGNYQLTFIATEDDNATVLENELVKVTVPVAITVPTFDELFAHDQNWTDATTYTSRIIISGTEPYIEYANAFKNAGKFDVEASHIKVTFNALDEYNNYPIVGGTQYVTDNTKGVTTPISSDIKLNKDNVYNDAGNALEVSELTDMYAYYDVFDGLTKSQLGDATKNYEAVRQAFAIVSDAFDTQIKTALDGITAAVYSNNSIVNPVIIGDDKTIAVGSGDGKEDTEFNGFVIRLGNDYLHVNKNNLDGGNHFDKLGIFSLFDSVVGATDYNQNGNNVKVEFKGANNETISWDTSATVGDKQSITVDMGSVDSSTLNITFTDATGIVYKQEIKIQKER